MKFMLAGAVSAAVLFASGAWAQSSPMSDADFVMKASVGNTFEVQESQLALAHATNPQLKAFAKRMIADHGKAEKELQAAARKTGAKAAMMLDPPHQAMVDNLKTQTGANFDKAYTSDQVAAHAESATLLTDYQQNGKNASLKAWTSKTLPVVKMHQEMITKM